MSLAARMLLAFTFVALLSALLFDLSVRKASREQIEADFARRVEHADAAVRLELAREAEDLKTLLPPLCEHDTFFDKLHLQLERAKGNVSELDADTWIQLRAFVPDEARARRLDDLVLFTEGGMILGASDVSRVGTKDARLASMIKLPAGVLRLRASKDGADPALEVACAGASRGVVLAMVGARKIATILQRIAEANAVDLKVLAPNAPAPSSDEGALVRTIDVPEVLGFRLAATVSKAELTDALARLDASILVGGAIATLVAMALAFVLARTISRPIAALAAETREVMAGEARPVKGRGGKEIKELADAFNHALEELGAMKKRLAATERIAARREVARQIAHEIKNPLAPIRAAVETLRRLRARDDPAFDDYFEEATTTVLEEVLRISNIVSEFTRFNRLPAPTLEPIDLAAVAKGVVALHAHVSETTADLGKTSPKPRVELSAEEVPTISADKDQIVQVLTNLIQNGLDAASAARPDPRVVVTIARRDKEHVRVVVRDNGPGVSDAMVPRLFEPYATSKEKGTGLGLAIVQRIVFEHGGSIEYRKGTKGGAIFEIVLPIKGPPLLERPPNVDQTGKPETQRGDAPRRA